MNVIFCIQEGIQSFEGGLFYLELIYRQLYSYMALRSYWRWQNEN